MKLVLSGNRYVQIPQLNSMLFCLKFIQDEHEPMSGQGPPPYLFPMRALENRSLSFNQTYFQ